MIVATNHVGDPGVHIIDGDREVVENTAVDAGDHRVVEMGVVGANLAQDHVVYDGLARVGHAQPDGTFVLGHAPKSSLGAVGRLVGPDVLSGSGGSIGVAVGQQRLERLAVAF